MWSGREGEGGSGKIESCLLIQSPAKSDWNRDWLRRMRPAVVLSSEETIFMYGGVSDWCSVPALNRRFRWREGGWWWWWWWWLSLTGAATSIIFVATKHVFCRDKNMLVATNIFLAIFLSTKIILSRQIYVCRDKSMRLATK